MPSKVKLKISADEDTEEVIQDILNGLTGEQIDELEILRSLEPSEGVAGEPITISAVLTGSALVIRAVLRLLEKHMETRREERALSLVAEGFKADPELGRQLTELSMKHADVAIKQGIVKVSWS